MRRVLPVFLGLGNSGCRYDDVAQVPLNDSERCNMKAIKSVEIKKGC
jgi:hypothetical protein